MSTTESSPLSSLSSITCSVHSGASSTSVDLSLSLSLSLPFACSPDPTLVPLTWSSESPVQYASLPELFTESQTKFIETLLKQVQTVLESNIHSCNQTQSIQSQAAEPLGTPSDTPSSPPPISLPRSPSSSISSSLALRLSLFPRLFDHFFVFGASPAAIPNDPTRNLSSPVIPRVLLRFPHSGHLPFSENELGQFAFPSGSVPVRFSEATPADKQENLIYSQRNFFRGSHVHAFLLKNFSSQHQVSDYAGANYYGLAVIVEEVTKINNHHYAHCSVSYVFLTRFPVLEFVQELGFSLLKLIHLKRVQQLASSDSVPDRPLGPHQLKSTIELLKSVYTSRMPMDHSDLLFPIPKLGESLVFRWPLDCEVFSQNANFKLQHEWAAVEFYRYLDVETLITLVELLLLEYKIIVAGENSACVSAAVLALSSLLHPLQWQSLLAPVLPLAMRDFCHAPVPVLTGVVTVGPELIHMVDSTSAVWRMDRNRLMGPTRFNHKWKERETIKKEIDPLLKQLKEKEESGQGQGKSCNGLRDTIRNSFERAITRSLQLTKPIAAQIELDLGNSKDPAAFESLLAQTQMFHEWMQADATSQNSQST
jgi:hypothetical protein